MATTHSGFGARFGRLATHIAGWVGSPIAFLLAAATIIIWGTLGPRHHYSDTWQLVVNTGTTIVTFLMVFLIQNTQNRDARAIHLKLDELIRSLHAAHNDMINIEKLSDDELRKLADRYDHIREAYEARRKGSHKQRS